MLLTNGTTEMDIKGNMMDLKKPSLVAFKKDENISEKVFEKLKGRRFFAVSVDKNDYQYHFSADMTNEEVIYGCEMLKQKVLNEE